MIVEHIEYHKHLGIKHFVMYDAGGFSENASKNLNAYLTDGTLEVVPFLGVDRFEIVEDGMVRRHVGPLSCILKVDSFGVMAFFHFFVGM